MKLRRYLHKAYPFFNFYQKRIRSNSILSSRQTVSVLLFHEISDVEKFSRLIIALQGKFDFITPLEFENFLSKKCRLKRDSLLVTFDDGYRSSYRAASEVLDKKNIKSVFFVSSDFMDLNEEESYSFVKNQICVPLLKWDNIYSAMSWKEARQLQNNGHMIASHTSSHLRLNQLVERSKVIQELELSSQKIEKEMGKKPSWFAYPFGDIKSIDAQVLQQIKQRYKYCLSGVRGLVTPETDAHTIPRQSLSLSDEFDFNQLIVLGGLDLYYSFDRWKLKQMNRQSPNL